MCGGRRRAAAAHSRALGPAGVAAPRPGRPCWLPCPSAQPPQAFPWGCRTQAESSIASSGRRQAAKHASACQCMSEAQLPAGRNVCQSRRSLGTRKARSCNSLSPPTAGCQTGPVRTHLVRSEPSAVAIWPLSAATDGSLLTTGLQLQSHAGSLAVLCAPGVHGPQPRVARLLLWRQPCRQVSYADPHGAVLSEAPHAQLPCRGATVCGSKS